MTRRARLWTGATIVLVLAFNYLIIGLPLMKRASSIEAKSKSILVGQVKAGKLFKNTEDEYMLDILKREKRTIDRKILVLNCLAATCLILAASWVVFGLIARPK